MREVTKEQVIAALVDLGIQAGDGLLVHSAIQFLGRPAGGVGVYLQSLHAAIGPGGTLSVPAFNFAFARGERYDPQTTPAQGMGVFSEYVRTQPGVLRTPHPMQSFAASGSLAGLLAERDTPSAFDPGSAFELMLEKDFKLLLLGADVQAAAAIHYSEQRLAVPYRYWKDFSGEVLTCAGWQKRTYRMYARDLEMDAQLNLRPVQNLLQSWRQWASAPLNYGWISACRLSDFIRAADQLLAEDPWSLVDNREAVLHVYRQKVGANP